jgi:hypothetical protein
LAKIVRVSVELMSVIPVLNSAGESVDKLIGLPVSRAVVVSVMLGMAVSREEEDGAEVIGVDVKGDTEGE